MTKTMTRRIEDKDAVIAKAERLSDGSKIWNVEGLLDGRRINIGCLDHHHALVLADALEQASHIRIG